jgi:glycosyltransferase involved in cell wall biosynthesis
MSGPNVVAMVSIFNEEDIIVEVLENLLDQDLVVVALDHGSDDRSYELCRELAGRRPLDLRRWEPKDLDLEALTLRLYQMAQEHDPDWLLFSDGDELHQARPRSRTIREVIRDADATGANILQYDRFDFFVSDADEPSDPSPVRRLKHYSWQGDFNYRAFRNLPGLRASPSFAHLPLFPEGTPYRVAPERLVLRHYPYRSRRHASRKIENLLHKMAMDPAGPQPWHGRYRRISEEGRYLEPVPHERLARYDEDDVWITKRLYAPFTDDQPTAEDLFTPDGALRHRPKPTLDWGSRSVDRACTP